MGKSYDSAIIYRKSNVKLINSGTFWLSETPETPFSKYHLSVNIRSCTWGLFKHLKSKKEFFLFNTHLDHASEASRRF